MRPRVLHIITRLDAGGAATNTLASVRGLHRQGWDTALAYGVTEDPHGRVSRQLSGLGVASFLIPCLVRNVSPLNDLRAFASLLRIIRRGHYDLIHTHSSKAGALGRGAAACLRVPVIHTPHGHIFYGYYGKTATLVFTGLERMLTRVTARVISLTDMETEEYLSRGIGTDDLYRTIPSGVPIADFRDIPEKRGIHFRRHHDIPDNVVVFLSAGRLTSVKGFDILLRSFAGSPLHTCLVIAGDGEERAELEKTGGEMGIGTRVRFVGELEDMRPALSAADVFILASRNEGMGRVFIEAMASGLPVIGADVGGIPAFLDNNTTGLLVRSEDIDGFSAAIRDLAQSRERRTTMGRLAAKRVYPGYDEDTMIDAIAKLYSDTLSGNSFTSRDTASVSEQNTCRRERSDCDMRNTSASVSAMVGVFPETQYG